jgi:UDP-glucose 4-epimerase
LAIVWPITWISARATRWPVVGPLVAAAALPLFSKKSLNISYIPINEGLGGIQSSHLPREIVRELIERSSHRVIIERCTCRDARDCTEHPVTLGCTLVGEGTKEIDPRIDRHVSVAEALDHLDRTLADGLIPMVGRVKLDNLIWGVRDRGQLLTICHCCRCCCTIFASGKYFPEEAAKSIVALEGVSFTIDHELCTRCGDCVRECFMGALSMTDGNVVRNEDLCKACGRCEAVCRAGATRGVVTDRKAAMASITGRLSGIVNIE